MCAQGNIVIMVHSQAVMDKGETSCAQSCREELVHSVSHLQIKERKDVCTRKYYHDVLTNCEGQRRNECVHSAKKRRVGAV